MFVELSLKLDQLYFKLGRPTAQPPGESIAKFSGQHVDDCGSEELAAY